MTLLVSDIETKALKLADSDAGDFSTAIEVIPWINEAQREIVKPTECLVATDTIITTAGENTYALNADFWKEKRVTFDGDKIDFTEYDELQSLIEEAVSADTARYTLWNNQIILYTGDDILAGVSLVVEYFKFAADVTGAGSPTEIPDKYADTIQFYVASMMAEYNADFALAERRMSQFFNRLGITRANDRRSRSGPRKIKTEIYDKYSF